MHGQYPFPLHRQFSPIWLVINEFYDRFVQDFLYVGDTVDIPIAEGPLPG